MTDFDAIVIGSGFGGAVTACRLAEGGYTVLVLERGRRWDPSTFPRAANDPWVWDDAAPLTRNGWFDFRVFPHMTVVQGAGVGGGSLVYANISVEAKPKTFDTGWPAEITLAELQPYYAMVGTMLDVKRVPETQWPERTRLMKDAADNTGRSSRFQPLELAVSFDDQWTYSQTDPHAIAKSKTFTNAQGQQQGTCVHLGNCDIGCDVRARNTLDLNYLPRAEKHGAEVRALHQVTTITPEAGAYRVAFNRIDVHQTLPNLSASLGVGWSSNGDFLTPAIHPLRPVNPTRGPTITAAIDLLDGAASGQDVFIEDGGLPDLASGLLGRLTAAPPADPTARLIVETLRPLLAANLLTEHVMPWFAQSRDAGDGVFTLKNGRLSLAWDVTKSKPTIDAVVQMHHELANATGGMALTPLPWSVAHDLITPHPLGGCRMGKTAADGVVAHNGEVFGYPNVFVADGAIVPKALGLNPSKTIGALAERIAALIVADGR